MLWWKSAASLAGTSLRARVGPSYLLDELLLVQQVQPGDAVLLLQSQCEVLDAADGQLLPHREDDVLVGTQRHGGT